MAIQSVDSFLRSNQSGWGTASNSETWSQIDGTDTLSIISNEGNATGKTNTNSMRLGSQTAKDVEGLVRTSVSATNARTGIELRVADLNNYYVARINGTTNKIEVCKMVAGTLTVLASSATFTVTASTFYWLRFRVEGTTVEAKGWADGSGEPGSWSVTTTDSSISAAGGYGLNANAGSSTTNIKWNAFTVTNLQDTRDIMMRARLSAHTITDDIILRARLAGFARKDILLRARLAMPTTTNTNDIKLRARLSGYGSGDILMRACLAETVIALPSLAANVLTVTIGSVNYNVLETTPIYSETIDGRSICQFTVLDSTGLAHFQFRQPVTLTHSLRGVIFTGFVNTSQEVNLYPNVTNTLQVMCVDEHYIADKRVYEGNEFTNQYAGNIFAYLANQLAQDGITASYAIDHDTTTADFAQGVLSGVIAAENVGGSAIGDGDLELAAAGSTVTISENTSTNFLAGTLTNCQANGLGPDGDGYLGLASSSAIKLTGTAAVPGGGNLYSYQKIWSGAYVFQAGDTLNYDVWIASTSPQIQAGVDIVMTDGSTLRDAGNQGDRDQQQIHAHPNADLSGFANDQWYTRQINTGSVTGKTSTYASVAFEGNNIGTYTSYFRNIRILDSTGAVKQIIYLSGKLNVSPAQQLQNQGYLGVSATVVTAYQQTGTRVSPAYSLSSAGIARSSILSWTETIPTDSSAKTSGAAYTITVEASLDGGLTYQTCTNNQPIPGVIAGMLLAGKTLTLRETLNNTTTDPTQTPKLTQVQATIQPSYADSTKRDVIATTSTQAQWLAGTLTGGPVYTGGAFSINGFTRTWDSASTSGQTKYGANAPTVFVSARQCVLQSDNNADVRSILNFAGQWQNFTAEVDVYMGSIFNDSQDAGLVYRCTGLQNDNDTYAYNAYVTLDSLVLAHGTNSAVGTGAYTPIATAALSLSSGNTHRLKVIANGNNHQVFLDDVRYINATDSTYTAAGYIGLRYFNGSGNMFLTTPGLTAGHVSTTVTVDYVSAPIGDATLITIDLGGVHTEFVYAYGAQAASATTTIIQITTNSAGSKAAQAAVTWGFNHATGALTTFPITQSLYFDNFGIAANTSVTRVSPPIDLSSAVTAWDSLIGWTENAPGSSTVLVEASLDGGATYATCTNGQAIGSIPVTPATSPVTYTAPLITQGQNLAGKSLLVRTTLTTNSVDQLPTVSDMSAWVIGQIHSSGYRISPPLSLSPIGRVGDSLAAWTVTLPNNNTTLGIDVSPNGINWTDISAGTTIPGSTTFTNSAVIPFIQSRGTLYAETFGGDNSVAYTSSFVTGSNGSSATWAVQPGNSRVVATGGVHALFSPNGETFGDGELYFDTDYADFGGCMWHLSSDLGTCYELSVQDSAAPRTPNIMRLFKVQNGGSTQLGFGVALSFTRGIPTRFKIVQKAGAITITTSYPVETPDGAVVTGNTQTLTYTDPTPLAAGLVALRSSGGTNRYHSLQCVQYGDDVTNHSLYTRARLATSDPTVTPQVQDLIISVYGDTIDSGSLIPNTTYSTLSGSTNTIAQDFDDLAKQSNYWWRILRGIPYFQPRTGQPAPFPITGNDMLFGAQVSVTYNSDLYRNEQIIIGGTDTVATTINDIADGFVTGFNTFDPVDSITSITINGQLQSFGIQGVDTGKQWYYQQGKQGITQDTSQIPLAKGTTVSIACNVQIQVIAKARNEGQINLLASIDKTSGVVTVVEQASGLDSAAAQALALSRINQYATLAIDLGFTTCRPGLHIGQLLTVSLSQHSITDMQFLITAVDYSEARATVNGTQTLLEYFKVACTSGAVVGLWSHMLG